MKPQVKPGKRDRSSAANGFGEAAEPWAISPGTVADAVADACL